MIRAIAATDSDRGIAAVGATAHSIPWDIPEDRAYFKRMTQNGTVIMGSSTYKTLRSPLPGRRNIVVSRTVQSVQAGFELISNLDSFLQQPADNDIWIIGGAGLYDSALSYCEELYITHVQGTFGCNRFFPNYESTFHEVTKSRVQTQNGHTFRYAIYAKNR